MENYASKMTDKNIRNENCFTMSYNKYHQMVRDNFKE